MEEARRISTSINDEVCVEAATAPNANDIAMDGGDASDSDLGAAFSGNVTATASPGAAGWVAETKETLTPAQIETFEIEKLWADLSRTLTRLSGDDNEDINDLWGGIVDRKSAEVAEKENEAAATRDKQDKEDRAKNAAAQAAIEVAEAEQAFEQARQACEDRKLKAAATVAAAATIAGEGGN